MAGEQAGKRYRNRPALNGQSVWLRRLACLAAAVPAASSAAEGTFAITLCPGVILTGPWYCFFQWKPMKADH